MNSFLIKRTIPFFLVVITIEFFALSILLISNKEYVDWSFIPMIKTIGILLKTTTFSFLYVMFPYVFYLLIIPPKYINSKIDIFITTTTFTLFVFFNLFEESMSLVFWEKFSSSFNQEAIKFLIKIPDTTNTINGNYLFISHLVALIIIALLITRRSQKYLFTNNLTTPPNWIKRFIYGLLYFTCCSLIFINLNEDELQIKENHYNNEISKDGSFSLAISIWKSDISYKDFLPLKIKLK